MRTILLLGVAALAGCATGPSRSEVLAGLVGRPEADALRVLGAPNRQVEANGSRFLAFDDRQVGYAPAPGFGPFGFGYGYGYYPATVPYVVGCETTLEVSGGIVRSWSLRGNGC